MWLAPRLPSPGPESTTSIRMQSENSFTQDQKIRLVKVSSTAGANSISYKAMLLRGALCFLPSFLENLESSTGLHLLHFRSWLPDRPVQLHVPKWCLWMDVQQSPDRARIRRSISSGENGKTRDQASLRDGSSFDVDTAMSNLPHCHKTLETCRTAVQRSVSCPMYSKIIAVTPVIGHERCAQDSLRAFSTI